MTVFKHRSLLSCKPINPLASFGRPRLISVYTLNRTILDHLCLGFLIHLPPIPPTILSVGLVWRWVCSRSWFHHFIYRFQAGEVRRPNIPTFSLELTSSQVWTRRITNRPAGFAPTTNTTTVPPAVAFSKTRSREGQLCVTDTTEHLRRALKVLARSDNEESINTSPFQTLTPQPYYQNRGRETPEGKKSATLSGLFFRKSISIISPNGRYKDSDSRCPQHHQHKQGRQYFFCTGFFVQVIPTQY